MSRIFLIVAALSSRGGSDSRNLDHPRDRPPEKRDQLLKRTRLSFLNRIFAVLFKPFFWPLRCLILTGTWLLELKNSAQLDGVFIRIKACAVNIAVLVSGPCIFQTGFEGGISIELSSQTEDQTVEIFIPAAAFKLGPAVADIGFGPTGPARFCKSS